jgi:DNA-binding MarR family transcriptional regulator
MSSTVSPAGVAPDRLSGSELAAWRGMLRAHAAVVKALDEEMRAAHGLPLSSYEVLIFLCDAEGGRMRMSDLADAVLLSRSGLTRLVDRLERDGLIAREICRDDARGAFATITDAGRAMVQVARPTHLDGVRRLFLSHLGEGDRAHLAQVWERVLGARGGAADRR